MKTISILDNYPQADDLRWADEALAQAHKGLARTIKRVQAGCQHKTWGFYRNRVVCLRCGLCQPSLTRFGTMPLELFNHDGVFLRHAQSVVDLTADQYRERRRIQWEEANDLSDSTGGPEGPREHVGAGRGGQVQSPP